MAPERYSLAEVLAIARIHPFYLEDIKYPPDTDTIQAVLRQPLLQKKSIYNAVERL
jgi:hypothetical protein